MLKEIIATLLLCCTSGNTQNLREIKRSQNVIDTNYVASQPLYIGGSYYWEDYGFDDLDFTTSLPTVYFDFDNCTWGICETYYIFNGYHDVQLGQRNFFEYDVFGEEYFNTQVALYNNNTNVLSNRVNFLFNLVDYGDYIGTIQDNDLNINIVITRTVDGETSTEIGDEFTFVDFFSSVFYDGNFYVSSNYIANGGDGYSYEGGDGLNRVSFIVSTNVFVSDYFNTSYDEADYFYQYLIDENIYDYFKPIPLHLNCYVSTWDVTFQTPEGNQRVYYLEHLLANETNQLNERIDYLENEVASKTSTITRLENDVYELEEYQVELQETIENLERLLEYAEQNGPSGLGNVFSWFRTIFNSMGGFLNLEIAPGVKLSHLLAIPIVAAALFFVIKILAK